MNTVLSTLIGHLKDNALRGTGIITWSCPVPSFGDLSHSRLATLGLNPSNREFVDGSGNELEGPARRFHTLKSLGLVRWSDANAQHLRLIANSCRAYFSANPYNAWFNRLERIISGVGVSYYGTHARACHLDLIPYATAHKWTELTYQQRSSLLAVAGNSLGLLLRGSPIKVVVLNGKTVVEQFQTIAGIRLDMKAMRSWSLPRRSQSNVRGFSYSGKIREVCGVRLKREILVLGFNHNIQSSFGVTKKVLAAIARWITQAASWAFI